MLFALMALTSSRSCSRLLWQSHWIMFPVIFRELLAHCSSSTLTPLVKVRVLRRHLLIFNILWWKELFCFCCGVGSCQHPNIFPFPSTSSCMCSLSYGTEKRGNRSSSSSSLSLCPSFLHSKCQRGCQWTTVWQTVSVFTLKITCPTQARVWHKQICGLAALLSLRGSKVNGLKVMNAMTASDSVPEVCIILMCHTDAWHRFASGCWWLPG